MNLTISLDEPLAAQLRREASTRRLSPEQVALDLLAGALGRIAEDGPSNRGATPKTTWMCPESLGTGDALLDPPLSRPMSKTAPSRKSPPTRYCLDTTVVYYLLHGPRRQQEAARACCGQGDPVVTGFVRGEYIRG